jgi:hypothetical protein
MDELELGKKYRDTVSGWEGIATCQLKYMNGCVRYDLEGSDKDGQPKGFVFDGEQLELVGEGIELDPTPTGGDRSNIPVAR